MKPKEYVLIKPVKKDKRLKYEYFMDRNHPLADGYGKVYMHRHVTSVKMGRWLKRSEHAHHINEIRDDNNPNNIEVLLSGEHARKHHELNEIGSCKHCGKKFKIKKKRIYCSLSCARLATVKCSKERNTEHVLASNRQKIRCIR